MKSVATSLVSCSRAEVYVLRVLVFVNCLVKQLAMCLGVVEILLLNVMEVLVWVEVLCWIDREWSSKECAGCV